MSGMCGTGIIIQGRIVHGSIFRKKALSGTEMIPKQYNTPLRHRKLVGLHMEKRPLLGIYLTSGTILNPDLPSGNKENLSSPRFSRLLSRKSGKFGWFSKLFDSKMIASANLNLFRLPIGL